MGIMNIQLPERVISYYEQTANEKAFVFDKDSLIRQNKHGCDN